MISEEAINKTITLINQYKARIQREIDWTKVPRGTKVQVKNEDDEKWENRYLISFDNEYFNRPYYVSRILDNDYVGDVMEDAGSHWGQCRIHKSVEIPYKWYKD